MDIVLRRRTMKMHKIRRIVERTMHWKMTTMHQTAGGETLSLRLPETHQSTEIHTPIAAPNCYIVNRDD
jgi:hypothetical protein